MLMYHYSVTNFGDYITLQKNTWYMFPLHLRRDADSISLGVLLYVFEKAMCMGCSAHSSFQVAGICRSEKHLVLTGLCTLISNRFFFAGRPRSPG